MSEETVTVPLELYKEIIDIADNFLTHDRIDRALIYKAKSFLPKPLTNEELIKAHEQFMRRNKIGEDGYSPFEEIKKRLREAEK